MSQPNVLVIVLNWKQPQLTLTCVRSLQAMDPPLPDILVVDNGSDDNSAEIFTQALAPDQLILLPENTGFAGGMNAGLRRALEHHYDFALLLNNDAFPAPDMLNQLLAAVEPDIGLYSPLIFYEQAPRTIWFAGGSRHPALLELRERGRGETFIKEAYPSRDVDYLLGTCLLVDMPAAKKVGLLDESFFMYYEDLDWSIRFQEQHYRLRMIASAHLYHQVAVSSGGLDSPIRRYYLARSSILFFRRHARLGRPFLILLFRLGSAIRTLLRSLRTGQIDSARAYLRGLRDGLRDIQQTK